MRQIASVRFPGRPDSESTCRSTYAACTTCPPGAGSTTDDLLVRAGVLADDNSQIVAAHDGSRVRLDRENPRVEIEIVSIVEVMQ